MGCAFEAAKSKQQRTKKQQQQQQEQQQQQNQCGARRVTRTTAITTITRTTTTKPAEDIKIKDNYQQNHKTARETETETANDSKHLKARAQVLLTTQQQQQSEQQHPATQQQPSRSQVVYSKDKDENKEDELAGRQRIGIDIQATTTNTTKQITCSNCYSQRRKRQHRQQYQQDKDHVRLRSRLRPPDACTAAAATAAAATTAFNFQEMLWQATVALANTNHNHDRRDRNEDELAYQRWQPPPLPSQSSPSPLPSQSPSPSYLPATTAAMSASILATSASAAYQYLGQHYKHYSQSFSFYAASSVILMLCYLTTATTAAATQSETSGALDKHPIFDESSSDKEILDLLLEKKRYDKRLLPPVNDEDFCCGLQSPDMATNQNARRPHNRGTLTVNVNVLLLSLASPDESSLKYEVEFLLNQQWNDPRLQYGNKSHYDFLNALHHHDSIWTPDTYFIMHGDFKDPIIPMHFALRIFRNGTITYAMRRHLILSCQGSLHIFPFDDPKCSFSMESISYEEAQIKYVWKNDEDTLRKSPSLTTLNAYLIKNQTTACDQNSWRGNYSCLQVELTFTRDRAYYFTTVFIPGIILVTSSFITFWLEWNAVPARVMIGVTTMLNFFTTSNGFRSTLPVVSNLTAMNVWDGVCMCFIYASLLEFVCVNYVGRKRPLHNVVYRPGENPVTQRLPAVLSRIGVILASPLASAGATPAMSTMTHTPATAGSATPRLQPDTEDFFGGGGGAGMRWQEAHGGIIGAAVQNLRARSIKRKAAARTPSTSTSPTGGKSAIIAEHIYEEPTTTATRVKFKDEQRLDVNPDQESESTMALRRSVATSTPALVMVRIESETSTKGEQGSDETHDMEMTERQRLHQQEQQLPLKPPRKKSSRSNSPASVYAETCVITGPGSGSGTDIGIGIATSITSTLLKESAAIETGEKRRDAGATNEIVACTTCGGGSNNSPCTHSANNGCATETCFVQVRKKEPPHPIRVAKTIDVIARITFPTAYAIFLIFFFVHYKGFS
ncbi:uncharacterized protein pHCl-1 isoform X4 [Drosophila tropicalis]|uniref:uncharacterized protein pHCl-1 isoform X4 n=1 Tax=Drosophila tropicalis TaxID=46794 RepID=UPI0035AB931F